VITFSLVVVAGSLVVVVAGSLVVVAGSPVDQVFPAKGRLSRRYRSCAGRR
jgi:hypothetical protein